jgi:hypothetical protein
MSEHTPTDLPHRISEKIHIDENGCWIWHASRTPAGYGKVWWNGQLIGSHRLTYTLLAGEIPDGLVIDHLCRVRECCNPEHLRPCTQLENVHAPGSLCPSAIQAKRTHCPKGHPLTGDNLFTYRGHRDCLTCRRERTRQQHIRERQVA